MGVSGVADGNDTTEPDSPEHLVQQRMLARRRLPVGIPEADKVPENVNNPDTDGTEQR